MPSAQVNPLKRSEKDQKTKEKQLCCCKMTLPLLKEEKNRSGEANKSGWRGRDRFLQAWYIRHRKSKTEKPGQPNTRTTRPKNQTWETEEQQEQNNSKRESKERGHLLFLRGEKMQNQVKLIESIFSSGRKERLENDINAKWNGWRSRFTVR